jgi:hypothetical protein
MKTLSTAVTLLATLLIASSGLLVTHASTTNSYQQQSASSGKSLSLGLQGVIVSAGNQKWSVSGGNLAGAQLGQEIVPPGANLQYSLSASVRGLTSTGSVQLSLSGTTADGQSITFNANGQVVGMIPSVCFPSYSSPDANGNCPTTDTSTIPAFFKAVVSSNETLGTVTTTNQLTLLVESPIMSPWGAPIAIVSTDGSVNIVTSYSNAIATWSQVKLTGTLTGTYNGQQASGSFTQTSNAVENLVTGTEFEFGSVAFQNMSPSSLNAKGYYTGNSSVPTAGSYDCAALAGLPEGTCTETGLASTGSYMMMGQSGSIISGSYVVNWPAPSVTFSGSMTATVKTWSQQEDS